MQVEIIKIVIQLFVKIGMLF
ncbi:MAG: hypothetical protein JWQ57_3460, partial [Mucilaginibacter sp.]|nr:hypothetical protein [Mucilaginibacter sp.]